MGFFTQQQRQPRPQPESQPQPQRPAAALVAVFTAVRAAFSPAFTLTQEQRVTLARDTGHPLGFINQVANRLQQSVMAAAEAQALQGAGDVADADSAFRAILLRDKADELSDNIGDLRA